MAEITKEIEKFAASLGYLKINPDGTKIKPWQNIELTQQETENALDAAKETKWNILERQRIKAETEARRQEAMRAWTTRETAEHAEFRAINYFGYSKFVGDGKKVFEPNMDIFKLLARYFSDNPNFESTGEYSLKKGICLVGGVGVGKTELMRVFARQKKACYDIFNCRDIASSYARDGVDAITPFCKPMPAGHDYRMFYQEMIGICFDDFGAETAKKNFGNEMSVMEEIFLSRYANSKIPHIMTHITTNLNPDEILAQYGPRVSSRFKEMFNIIILPGDDRRK